MRREQSVRGWARIRRKVNRPCLKVAFLFGCNVYKRGCTPCVNYTELECGRTETFITSVPRYEITPLCIVQASPGVRTLVQLSLTRDIENWPLHLSSRQPTLVSARAEIPWNPDKLQEYPRSGIPVTYTWYRKNLSKYSRARSSRVPRPWINES